jgi:type I restriction enzyme, S subunit
MTKPQTRAPEAVAKSSATEPDGWARAALGDLAAFTIGGDWGQPADSETSLGLVHVSVIRSTEFRNWDREKGATAAKRALKPSSLERRRLEEGDIVVEISGGGPGQPVGRTLIIDADALTRTNSPLVCSNFCRLMRVVEGVSPMFLNYQLGHLHSTGAFDQFQTQTTNLRNLNFNDFLKGVNVSIAPLVEQKRIIGKVAALLARVNAARENSQSCPRFLSASDNRCYPPHARAV